VRDKMNELIRTETKSGETINAGEVQITPFSKSTQILSDRKIFGLIWNRPDSILVQKPDGSEQILPVIDVTRQAIWAILGISTVIFMLLTFITLKKDK
jgi:hypothetical protein